MLNKTKKHILIIVQNLPVPPDFRVWQIAKTLRDDNYKVSVISPASAKYPPGEFEIEGIKVYRHSMPFEAHALHQYILEYSYSLFQQIRLTWKIWRRGKFDIIHGCNPPDLIWIVALFWRIRGVKYVFDQHDLCPELLLAKSSNVLTAQELSFFRKLVYKGLVFLENCSQKSATVVLATNNTYRKIALVRNGCAPNKVFTVRSGPIAIYPKAAKKIPNQIAYVGVMSQQDGVDQLLLSLNYLKLNLTTDFKAVLIGDGNEKKSLEKMVQSLGLQDQVEFTGFLTRNQLLKILANSTIGVTPDPFCPMNASSTMLKALDYMCCGLPQVMNDMTENRASAGASALYANSISEFAKHINSLLKDSNLRDQLSQIAIKRIAGLTWEAASKPALLKAYKKAID